MNRLLAALLGAIVTGCAANPPSPAEPQAAAAAPPADRAPYSSTYVAPASPPTLIRNATILTGTGTRIDGGDVLIEGGKIKAVGQSLAAPEGAVVIDASGRWVTPGLIDVHSHLGVYGEPGRRGPERRQRGDRSGDFQRLGRAQRVAAGSGPRGRAAGRRHVDPDPAGLREPDRRARRDDQERAGDDLPGHEIPGRAAGTQDGLRREPEARLRRRRPVPLDPHGQRRRLPPGLRGREGLHGGLEGVRRQAREVRQGKGKGRRGCGAAAAAEAGPQARDARRGDARPYPRAQPLLSRRRDGDDARHREGVRLQDLGVPPRRRGLQDRGPARRGRRLRRALGRLVGLQDGSLRCASRKTSRWWITRQAAAPSSIRIPRKGSSG